VVHREHEVPAPSDTIDGDARDETRRAVRPRDDSLDFGQEARRLLAIVGTVPLEHHRRRLGRRDRQGARGQAKASREDRHGNGRERAHDPV
jgi:hypothetical protein